MLADHTISYPRAKSHGTSCFVDHVMHVTKFVPKNRMQNENVVDSRQHSRPDATFPLACSVCYCGAQLCFHVALLLSP